VPLRTRRRRTRGDSIAARNLVGAHQLAGASMAIGLREPAWRAASQVSASDGTQRAIPVVSAVSGISHRGTRIKGSGVRVPASALASFAAESAHQDLPSLCARGARDVPVPISGGSARRVGPEKSSAARGLDDRVVARHSEAPPAKVIKMPPMRRLAPARRAPPESAAECVPDTRAARRSVTSTSRRRSVGLRR
jgi:hypothetical protein